uniref:C-type lectin domain-containing protein n=1 Tax=Poecilia latipinna TaxID=48699 RepID=A0A3B3UV56_9TELE
MERPASVESEKAKWVYFSGSFYYVSTTKKSWHSSQYDCRWRGADLVIISSREEEEFTRMFQKRAWIGLTDRIREGSFKWVDGTALTRSCWRFGEPNQFKGRNEDCVEIQNFDSERSWNDAQCANENYWICEKNFDI